jgi:hypothetical protein
MFATAQICINKFLGAKGSAVYIFYFTYESADKHLVFRWLTSASLSGATSRALNASVRAAVDLAIVSVACIQFNILPYKG